MDDEAFLKVAQPATCDRNASVVSVDMFQFGTGLPVPAETGCWRGESRRCDWRALRCTKKTVGAGISPSASLSDQDTISAATPERCRARSALILTVLPVATRGQRPFQTTPISTLAGFAQRAIEGFSRPSWQHRSAVGVGTLSAAPVGLGIRPSSRRTCSRFGPYGPQEIRLALSPFGWGVQWPPEMGLTYAG